MVSIISLDLIGKQIKGNKMKKIINGGCFYGKQTPTKYDIAKEKAREQAEDWQHTFGDENYSFYDLFIIATYFQKLAKRFGLTKEFKENGII